MKSRSPLFFTLPTTVLFMLVACGGGNGNGLDKNGQPISDENSELEPSLASIQRNVFSTSCGISGCHDTANRKAGLVLDSPQNSNSNLINISSQNYPTYLRVNPSDPDNSVLIKKLEGSSETGNRMPLGKPALPADTIRVIRQWITNGAID